MHEECITCRVKEPVEILVQENLSIVTIVSWMNDIHTAGYDSNVALTTVGVVEDARARRPRRRESWSNQECVYEGESS